MEKKLEQKDRILIAAIVCLFIILIYCFMFIIQPLLKKIIDYNEKEKIILAQLKSAGAMAADRENLTKEVAQIKKQIEYYEARLPLKVSISEILNQLVKAGTESGVTFVSIEPQEVMNISIGEMESARNYLEIPIQLRLKAGFHECACFINNIENFQRFMKVDNIQINADKSLSAKHDISLTVTAFAMGKKE
ncbi:MAG: type 4a pilus biogenesis protein PilO [Candidatus Omnitrophica bacterium]|nr:type 4a pilus biogenesis protein PilO [Candidatus Omnitrophota bacterium]MBU4478378.1 type 4a pilus biogenesis protein PilO [Candidatus Omnitrophota bacterium]MCG2703955.1 type 4a pilus biogenesis protein PilO [Candidatus Omnitrophota bacterium]